MYVCHLFLIDFREVINRSWWNLPAQYSFVIIIHNFFCTVMELQDNLEVETHTRMHFFAATVTLGVLLGLIVVVLIVLGAMFFALTQCCYCQGWSLCVNFVSCTILTGNVCSGIELTESSQNEFELKRSHHITETDL